VQLVLSHGEAVTSAEQVKCREITPVRMFEAGDVRVMYNAQKDRLYCNPCGEHDNCEHTARVRLSGLLTHSVVRNVVHRKKGLAVINGGKA
jgi:hypothetical protein